MQAFVVMNTSNILIGNRPRGYLHLHCCDVITKELQDHNTRKEFADVKVQWQSVIREIQGRYNCKECDTSETDTDYNQWVR